MTTKCACCKCPILATESEPECVSSLYGSQHVLCKGCSDDEEEAIKDAGTNEVPYLLEVYGAPNVEWEK